MTPNNNQILLLELADAILRSWWVVVAGVCLGLAGSEIALQSIRPIYESAAVVNVDAEKLPRDMVRTTVPEAPPELQIGVVRNAVLRDENIQHIVQDEFEGSGEPQAALVNRVLSNVRFVSNADPRKPLLTIRYRDTDPERAARVAQAVANMTVAENAEIRARTAARVTDTVESLSGRVESELESVNRKIRELYARYPYQTNVQRQTNEQALLKVETELAKVTSDLEAARERKANFEAARATGLETGPAPAAPGSTVSANGVQIARLEAEIAELRITHQDRHPAIQSRLQLLENLRRSDSSQSTGAPTDAPSPTPKPFDATQSLARAATIEVQRLVADQNRILAERDRYRAYLAVTPRVQEELDDLITQRDRLERDLQAKDLRVDTARTGQQIEEEKVGNPFEIIDPAYAPSTPVWPNRLQFLGIGVAAGLVLFLGPILAWRLLRPIIVSEAGLRALGDVPVLISVPVIPTPASERRDRRLRMRNLGIAAASVLAVLAAHAVRFLR